MLCHVFWSQVENKIVCFISESLRVVGLLGEKFTFFNSLGRTKMSRSLRLPVYINVVLLINFPEQFELCFHFKYSRSYKVYNLGDKTFETDFRFLSVQNNYY